MNCIYCCIFNKENYEMVYLFLESIFIYGILNDNTHIVLYTTTSFMTIIKKSNLFDEKIKFEINDNTTCGILEVFNLSVIQQYNKILYLNTNNLLKDNIDKVFDICIEDILYVLEEGNINDNSGYWGKTLFGDEINNYTDSTAFTNEIILFNNCEKIKNLFNQIKDDIINRPYSCINCDQPHIIYNAFKYNLYNNKILKSLIGNNYNDIQSNKTIYNFSGVYKIDNMTKFLNNIKEFTITNNINNTKEYINEYLLPIINNCNELLEGNIFMLHHTTTYTDTFLNKTKNISNLLLNKNIKSVMEIGFNSGFSSLLMLLTNNTVCINCYDLGCHKYTLPCYEKLKETFGKRINITIGDSTQTLKNVNDTYDLIHIDGGHATEVANSDIINSYRLSKKGTILIMDDYDADNLHKLWNSYIINYNLKNLVINVYNTIHHDIKYVCVNNLPLPKGGWIHSSRNYYVTNGNMLNADCKNMNGAWITNYFMFNNTDELNNHDGKLIRL